MAEEYTFQQRVNDIHLLYKEGELTDQQKADADLLIKEGVMPPPLEESPYDWDMYKDDTGFIGANVPRVMRRPPSKYRKAAETGVDIHTGAPAKTRALAEFAANEAERLQHFRESLNTAVRVGPVSGQEEYWNPKTMRWTLVDEFGATFKDIPELIPEGTAMAAAGAGFAYGGVPGAGLAVAGHEAARIGVGRALGVSEASPGEIARHSLGAGLIEMVMAKGSDYATRLAQKGYKFWKPDPPVERDMVEVTTEALLRANEEDIATVNQIDMWAKQVDEDVSFAPTPGQIYDDPYMMGVQKGIQGRAEIAGRFEAQSRDTAQALENSFLYQNQHEYLEGYSQGQEVINNYRSRKRTIQEWNEQKRKEHEWIQQEINDYIENVYKVYGTDAEAEIGQAFAALYGRAAAARDAAYARKAIALKIDPQTGLSEYQVRLDDNFIRYYNNIKRSSDRAWYKTRRAQLAQLKADQIEAAIKNGTPVNLRDLDEAIVGWKETLDLAAARGDAPTARVQTAIAELQGLRDSFLENVDPAALHAVLDAEASAKNLADTFNRGLLAATFKRKYNPDGTYIYAVQDSKFVASLMNITDATDPKFAWGRFAQMVGRDPEAQFAARRLIFTRYRQKAMDANGIINKASHDEFMKEWEDVIPLVFGDDARVFSRFGRTAGLMEDYARRIKYVKKTLSDTHIGQLAGTNPDALVSAIFHGPTIKSGRAAVSRQNVVRVRNTMETVGMLDPLQDAVRAHVRNLTLKNNKFQLNALDKFLTEQGNKVGIIMGQEYLSNMKTIVQAGRIAERTAKAIAPIPREGPLAMLNRVVFGPPLTARGRLQTLAVNLRYEAAVAAMGDILSDPKKLQAYIDFERGLIDQQKAMKVLGGLVAAAGSTNWSEEKILATILDITGVAVGATRDYLDVDPAPRTDREKLESGEQILQ